jgi:tripartite-type tricarboxylate transporter receptor subunit TctC
VKRLAFFALALAALGFGAAHAQEQFPNRPIKIIVAFGPGSAG